MQRREVPLLFDVVVAPVGTGRWLTGSQPVQFDSAPLLLNFGPLSLPGLPGFLSGMCSTSDGLMVIVPLAAQCSVPLSDGAPADALPTATSVPPNAMADASAAIRSLRVLIRSAPPRFEPARCRTVAAAPGPTFTEEPTPAGHT